MGQTKSKSAAGTPVGRQCSTPDHIQAQSPALNPSIDTCNTGCVSSHPTTQTPTRVGIQKQWSPSGDGESTIADQELPPLTYEQGVKTHNYFPRAPFQVRHKGQILCDLKHSHTESTLRISCPLIIDTLMRALGSHPSLSKGKVSTASGTVVNVPCELIFHNRKKISMVIDNQKGDDASTHTELLLGFLQENRPHIWQKFDDIDQGRCNEIAFQDLWIIYSPGSTVVRMDEGEWRAYKVQRVETSANPDKLAIYCYFLDFDHKGTSLVPHLKVLEVCSFSSMKPIGCLEVVPMWFFDKSDDFRKTLLDRGKKYWDYSREVFHCEYQGNAWPRTSNKDVVKIIVDYVTDSKHDARQCSTALAIGTSCSMCLAEIINLQPYPDAIEHDPAMCRATDQAVKQTIAENINDSECSLLFCPPKLWAFSLKHKSWKMVLPQDLKRVQGQGKEDNALDRLYMDWNNKQHLCSILKAHLKNRSSGFNLDVIKGKGKGFNILLHGNPGTGKTLTAECLAEKEGAPLYAVTCGDLGTDVNILEQQLEKVLFQATNWGAILLLDEVDVLFQKRSGQSLFDRNAIVSIFLHHLDYSEAFILMTTNRIAELDSAINERLHMALELPDLKFEDQKSIWTGLIERLDGLTSDEKESLKEFIDHGLPSLENGKFQNMNGRQIRNCISAALAMARRENCSLNGHHITDMLGLGSKFEEFISRLYPPLLRNIVSRGL
ncbi:P-loop containing nucleoside triphosphate hydrolase protein [Camillea tinctor]|nr:P-loop containing nucleoside triphosphate hydrolase protein [Camillea tinctor]